MELLQSATLEREPDACRLELRSMVLVEQVGRDAIPDGPRERRPLPGDRQLLVRARTVGDCSHLGECGSSRRSSLPDVRKNGRAPSPPRTMGVPLLTQ